MSNNISNIKSKGFWNRISNNPKLALNYGTNGIAATVCGLTVLNGNFKPLENIQENLEKVSDFFCKVATIASGGINCHSGFKDKNLLVTLGGILETPIAYFSSNYNLWLYRGFSLFLTNMQAVFSKLGIRDKDGKRSEKEFVSKNIKEDGHWKGLFTSLKEFPHVFKDIKNNSKLLVKSCPHALSVATTLQLIGSSIALCGLEKFGALTRNIGGTYVDIAFMFDKKKQGESGTSYFGVGATWVLAAITDFAKRFDFFSDRINNGTEIAMFIDRAANALFADTNDAVNNDDKKN